MKKLTLLRDYKPEATLGEIFLENSKNPLIHTLERPENGNKSDDPKTSANDSGCIPEGTYHVIWSVSHRFGKAMFEIKTVPDRSGVRIHGANRVDQLEGCIAAATSIINMNPKNDPKIAPNKKWYASQSQAALQKLVDTVGEPKEFMLTITSHV